MKILLTGFEPFGDMDINPSHLLMEWAATQEFEGVEIKTLSLPVVYALCAEKALEEMKRWEPDAVVHFGVAAGREAVNVERIAVNLEDAASFPDNSGDTPQDRPVVNNGPDGIFATLPVRRLTAQLQSRGVPAVLSYSAGTYICNTTLYRTLHLITQENLPCQAGFIHLPALPEMVTGTRLPSMAMETQQQALRIIVETITEEKSHDKR
ncbi:pyroglutamyl-peptidase I [Alkalicoccus daliensis]|uniref:Pyroglutamyl-peptidase I n=1 Tax=Alkalicoccus daliensis TaxID=745820 RepID=A0A1H0CSP1_9BACI|nr:pyroglutamyl-peptidase I [Alkalicoccus daliensis]SDN60893.1 pyroglutamyl-peptidase [Alkalicoccus daliensis]